ncbi:TetR/AcrR family transcriptional regulator [Nocardioides acrostichi]|uniref:TetR/AcrR family transcriptional regulator n=1 Tax=Nocardioides acrostichi TaxID=2784339 RepID=A0A930V282_9ACTN|nr:TetR/AcrR family transcriptional regulator [Nocardioides acrostichi]MBF4163315.1 TetR/AcrR family transcriptional regulator [Nocardioides acrostichi]
MGARRQPPTVRQRLLEAAEELFYAQGIAGTGVDAVIERAGVATGSLYTNFGGKDALVVAYLEERDRRWRETWERAIAGADEPVERVLALFAATARWCSTTSAERGCAHLAAALQLPAGHPGRETALAHKDHLARRLYELCAGLQLTGAHETGAHETGAAGQPGDHDGCRDLRDDLLMIYEGMNNQIALGVGPDPVARARRVAGWLIEARTTPPSSASSRR